MFLVLTWVDNRFGLVGSPLYTAYFVRVLLAAAIIVNVWVLSMPLMQRH